MTLAIQDRLIGSQEPRLASTAHGDTTRGDAAVEFCRWAGMTLFPWQEDMLRDMCRTDSEGLWSHRETVAVVPRQNGKGEVLRWADRMEWSLNPDVSFNPQNQLVEVIYPVDRLPGGIQAVVKDQLSTRMGLQFLRIA